MKLKAIGGAIRFTVKKYSPEILLGVGIVGTVGSTVLACRATLKANDIMTSHAKDLRNIEECVMLRETSDMDYSVQDERTDRLSLTASTVGKFIRLYGPSATLLVASVGCILASYKIMKARNVALMAAYKVIEEAFARYRKNVAYEFGKEKENDIYYGKTEGKFVDYDENGNVVKEEEATIWNLSGFARTFGKEVPHKEGGWDGSTQWSKIHDYNLDFLKAKTDHFNHMLLIKGFVTMNDVYEELGFPLTEAGMICGWRYNSQRGDGYISFKPRGIDGNWAFGVDGDGLILDFNIDGVIFDQSVARKEMSK